MNSDQMRALLKIMEPHEAETPPGFLPLNVYENSLGASHEALTQFSWKWGPVNFHKEFHVILDTRGRKWGRVDS